MNQEMTGKKILVTGASSGIGRATAALFLDAGATVALGGRRETRLADLVESSEKAFAITADLANEKQSEACMKEAVEKMCGLDVLINAAGILKSGRIEDTTL